MALLARVLLVVVTAVAISAVPGLDSERITVASAPTVSEPSQQVAVVAGRSDGGRHALIDDGSADDPGDGFAWLGTAAPPPVIDLVSGVSRSDRSEQVSERRSGVVAFCGCERGPPPG